MTVYPYRYHPQDGVFGGAWHIDYSVTDPSFIVASMAPPTTFDPRQSGYSTDGGYSWTPFATLPHNSTDAIGTFGIGSIHAASTNDIVWVSSSSRGAQVTHDRGATWAEISIPGVTNSLLNSDAYFFYRRPVAADKGTAGIFYAFVITKGVYKSVDAGATWTQQCDFTQFASQAGYATDWSQHLYLKAVPGHQGHLFVTMGYEGTPASPATNTVFARSTDGGVTWTRDANMKSVRGFGFGAPAPGGTYPSIYVMGYLSGVLGVYRSTDNAVTWTALQVGAPLNTLDVLRNIDGDKTTYGTFYITTTGSGLIVGTEDVVAPPPSVKYLVTRTS